MLLILKKEIKMEPLGTPQTPLERIEYLEIMLKDIDSIVPEDGFEVMEIMDIRNDMIKELNKMNILFRVHII